MSGLTYIPVLRIGGELYAQLRGLARPKVNPRRVIACPLLGQRLAAAYMAAPVLDRAAFPAYRAFRAETAEQFAYLTRPIGRGGLGINVIVSAQDPYQSARAMVRDVQEHRRLKIYATAASGNEHPFLSNDENDMFRAVHDAFGHAAIGRGFDPHGEEATWFTHSHMYSPLARLAMTTETRGQNSAIIYCFGGRHYPKQKAVLLPPEFSDLRSVKVL